jgi:hypothetical protein
MSALLSSIRDFTQALCRPRLHSQPRFSREYLEDNTDLAFDDIVEMDGDEGFIVENGTLVGVTGIFQGDAILGTAGQAISGYGNRLAASHLGLPLISKTPTELNNSGKSQGRLASLWEQFGQPTMLRIIRMNHTPPALGFTLLQTSFSLQPMLSTHLNQTPCSRKFQESEWPISNSGI